jgi:hypothetical protein
MDTHNSEVGAIQSLAETDTFSAYQEAIEARYLDNEGFSLPETEDYEEILIGLIFYFMASPSLLQEDINYKDGLSLKEHAHEAGFSYKKLLAGSISEYPSHDLAVFMEEWLIHGLIRAIFGAESLSIPRQRTNLEHIPKYIYRFDQLMYWLPVQAREWSNRLRDLQPGIMLKHYAQACSNYKLAYKVFMNVKPQLSAMPAQGGPELESGIKSWADSIWQWLLLFQVVGEQLRFSIEYFLVDLDHYHGHPGAGLKGRFWD